MRTRLFTYGMLWTVILALAAPAHGQVRVSARVDRTTIAAGESVQLEVRISGGEGDVDTSALTDFKVHSRSTSTSVQIINGRMTRDVAYHFVLVHRRQGQLTIPALPVEVDGESYFTDPIAITVTQPSNGGIAAPSREKNIWVTADLSEISPFVGQEIIYTFKLYNAVQIEDAKFQPPEFSGFSSKELENRRSYRKIINGREHMVTEIHFILIPLSQGPVTIDPAVLHVGIVRRDRRRSRSPFDNFFNRGIVDPRVLQTAPISLAARPLPPLPQGQMFSGLVGRFDMTAEIESTDLKVGDSATLAVTVQGQGNIMDAQAPEVQVPPAFKNYADNPEEEISQDRSGTHGKKIFRTALVPVDPGQYTLPAIDLVYFDVEKETYQTLRAEIPPLQVAAAPADAQAEPLTVTPGPLPRLKKKVAFTGRDILPPKEDLDAIKPHHPLQWPLFLLTLAGPALFFACIEFIQRLRRPRTGAAAVMKSKARRALKSAASKNTGEPFLSSLYQAVTAAIYTAAGRTGEALTWKEAESLLLENNISAEEAGRAAKLLSDIESYKFSGARLDEAENRKLLARTRKMVRKFTA
jgi:hypothetical protein